MRMRFTSFAVTAALLCSPLVARSQTDTSLKLSTTVPQASTEFKAGVTDWENFSVESSASHFAAAVKADPNFGLARAMWGFTAAGGDLTQDQARAEIKHGLADAVARGNTNELLLAAAYREQFEGNNRAAGALFAAAAQLMPGDRLIAANAAAFNADPNNPVPAFREFVSRYPSYAPAYNVYAYNLWTAGDRAAALEAAKRQVELNPNAPNPHDTYAEILEWSGKYPEAIAEYRRATTTSPRFPEAYAGLAEVEALQGHYDQARAYLNQAIANAWSPREKLSYMRQIAGTYALQGGQTEAIVRQLDAIATEARAQQNLPFAAIALAQKGTAYAVAGNTDAAHKAIAEAKAVMSPEPWQVNYFAAMAHGLMKHFAPADQEIAALKQKTASQAGARTQVTAAEAAIATQEGKGADALRILMAADTNNILIQNRIAEAHASLGHTAEANAWYAKVNNNYQLNLENFPSVGARRRSRTALAAKKP